MQVFFNESKTTHSFLVPFSKNDNLLQQIKYFGKAYNINEAIIEQMIIVFKAEPRETCPIVTPNGQKFCLLGVKNTAQANDIINTFRVFSFNQKAKLATETTIDLRFCQTEMSLKNIGHALNGLMLGTYSLALHKTAPPSIKHPFCDENAFFNIITNENFKNATAYFKNILQLADTQMRVMNLVNAPANFKTPAHLATFATESGKKFGYKTTIFDKKACEKEGLHALLAVGQGSVNDARFIVMEYKSKNSKANTPTIALIGKGVTFDTGGISIKPSNNMYLMKSDMGGAAAVFGAVEAAARLGLKINVVGIVCAAENMPDGNAFRPSDVISSYSGKTIEIIDTDAEGRLVLADGLAYAVKNFSPNYMIDLATLTGSAVAALGYQCAALFTQNDQFAQQIIAAGDNAGEKLWQLPMWDAYFDDMKSDVADVANLGNKPVAGAITAAKFLEFFTEKHPAWAHLDIASMAMTANEFGSHRNATAYGVRLLVELMEKL